jgi:predicted transposase/invertase (TIGR01784 family)
MASRQRPCSVFAPVSDSRVVAAPNAAGAAAPAAGGGHLPPTRHLADNLTMTTPYLDPKIDHAFKRLFGEHKHLLRSFLNAMLPLPAEAPIESLEYLSPEQLPEIPGLLKYSVVDVKCTDALGRIFIVEMQMMLTSSFESRIVFGASQAYVKQLKGGLDYRHLQPVYALALINQRFMRDTEAYYHHFKIVRTGEGDLADGAPQRVLKGLEFVLVELPKFKPTDRTGRQMQALWLRFLNEIGQDNQLPDAEMLGNADIAEAIKLMESSKLTRAQLDAYHASLDRARIETSITGDLLDEGMKRGLERGKAQGKAEGIAQAIIAMARSGLPVAQIAQILAVEVDEVERVVARSQAA